MAAGLPSPTKIWHNTSYSDISPSNPSIAPNIKGKSVVISGGGHGIGSTTAEAFAAAGAAQIHLLGRQEAKLKSTQESITSRHFSSKVHIHICDVTSHGDTARTAASAGPWDILVLNAGYLETPAKLIDSEPNEWWRAFTVNVQGLYNLTQAFLPKRNEGAVVVNTNAALCHMPPAFCATYSAYVGSKMAAAKIVEVLAAEIEDVHFVNMHPGVIETPMSAKAGKVDAGKVPFDDVSLPAHFALWLASPEAKFLRGKFVWCNWDVKELIERKEEIAGSALFTTNLEGFPFEPKL